MPVFYCGWLVTFCGMPQHIGLVPDAADFRLCCRTYTRSPFIGFLYWNMQYHVEHHMFPAVPFYNLPALRKAFAHDLPPATHGLWGAWRDHSRAEKSTRKSGSCFRSRVAECGLSLSLNLLPDFFDGLLGGDGVFPGVWKGGNPITGCHGAEFRAFPKRVGGGFSFAPAGEGVLHEFKPR